MGGRGETGGRGGVRAGGVSRMVSGRKSIGFRGLSDRIGERGGSEVEVESEWVGLVGWLVGGRVSGSEA